MSTALGPGPSFPLGATVCPPGVNVSVFSKSSTGGDLLLFNAVNDVQPARVLALDPGKHRTAHYWHASVHGLQPGQMYSLGLVPVVSRPRIIPRREVPG